MQGPSASFRTNPPQGVRSGIQGISRIADSSGSLLASGVAGLGRDDGRGEGLLCPAPIGEVIYQDMGFFREGLLAQVVRWGGKKVLTT